MHSLLVESNLTYLSKEFDAQIDEQAFLFLFKKRMKDKSIKFSKALEYELTRLPKSKQVDEIKKLSEEYRKKSVKADEEELKKQEKRLKEAEKKIKVKKTKTAQLELDRAKRKVEQIGRRIRRTKRKAPAPWESRIFPFYYAPVVVQEKGKRFVRPFRFHCRPAGQDASFDRKYSGCYKARRESLTEKYFSRIKHFGKDTDAESVWEPIFGKNHGIVVVKQFYENVPKHLHEKRKLKKGEKEVNVTLGFEPSRVKPMAVPVLFDVWKEKKTSKDYLPSFAIITGEAPADIVNEGYHRCPVFIKAEFLGAWLLPQDKTNLELQKYLNEIEDPGYQLVAA